MNSRNNKSRDRYRKNADRRGPEDRRPVLEPKPERHKRWKTLYETGELEDEDTQLPEDAEGGDGDDDDLNER
ncbi:MAG: hypothetical protein FJY97_13955 [candidate division Zixibacteria bacterium]|nr:hypothetical protein [candidate division Zixibacteria bacterium]